MRPRLLHVVGDSRFGGGGVLIIDLARAAIARGYEVAVLTTDPVFLTKLRDEGIRAVELDVIRRRIRPGWDLFGLVKLWRYLRSEEWDIVHTHTSKGGFVGRLAARLAGVNVVIHTVHGFAFHEQSSRLEKGLYVALERIGARASDLIVTVSEHHLKVAIDNHIVGSRLIAIPNGLDPSRVAATRTRAEVRVELGVGRNDVVLITIARLQHQKGIDDALTAMAILNRRPHQCRMFIAGEGPLADHLAARTKELGLDDIVRFLGFRNDIGDLLLAADVVVMPSLWEGLSISLLEAMAARKAIIATTIPSNIEVAGQCAVLVAPASPESLADAISAVASDPSLREDLATTAGHRFDEHYTQKRMVTDYLRHYEDLLASAGGR